MSDRRPEDPRHQAAAHLLEAFLVETGVVGSAPPRRYLWTDAFAVCTLLALDDAGLHPELAGFPGYRRLARRLVDQVHQVLGRHREDDPRQGWISGLPEAEGARRPTTGGLRIGKPLPERGPDEPWDERLEWERDGQYFHYLTKWMHALRRMSASEEDARYIDWAVALARAAYRGFVHLGADGGPVLYWKMSIDLSRPLVPSMARHDPLDGYLTYRTLVAPGAPMASDSDGVLRDEITRLGSMAGLPHWQQWVTDDPLGLGGLLTDAYRVAQLMAYGTAEPDGLLLGLLKAAAGGLRHYRASGALRHPPTRRLAFRELGLSIGLHALERLSRLPVATSQTGVLVDALVTDGRDMAARIEGTWSDEGLRDATTWRAHADINAVMLATSLVPSGYLAL